MRKHTIPFAKAGFSQLITDYLFNLPNLKPFYKYTPEIASFKAAIEAKEQQQINRKLLVEVLKEQYSLLSTHYSVLESLLNPKTFTVTTGHQLNIFTGPLYFIYKIITTIKLSQDLKMAYPDYNFVPIYWMASEDHDIAEINHTHIFGKELIWNTSQKGPAGRLSIQDLQTVLQELKAILGESEQAQDLYALFEKAYPENDSLADSTRQLVHELFGKYGLVIIDADDKRLKSSFSQMMFEDITKKHSHRLVQETLSKFEHYHKAQVHPREINFFYMEDGLRERIVEEEGVYKVINTSISFTQIQLKQAVEEYPEKLSPNVVTRPLYQEFTLPNLAYIGGPAEIAYWLEYKTMFEHYKIPYPVVVLRNCLLWLDESATAKIEKLNLTVEELFEDLDALINNYTKKHSEEDLSLSLEATQLAALFETIINKAVQIDTTLKAPVEGEKHKQLSALQMIEGRMIKAQKKKIETTLSQVKGLKEKLFPNDSLQERHDNFSAFYLKHGPQFFETLLEQSIPFGKEFVVLQE